MSGNGSITYGSTQVEWNEAQNRILARPNAVGYPVADMTYDGARELLDCLMVIFGRHDLSVRYPEVR